jgi:sporulation protein YlmC with PRC-barrel domain
MTAEMEKHEVDVRGASSGGEVHLVRDLLDKQLVDRRHEPMGRVDGVVLTFADGEQPRVASLESGMGVGGERVSGLLGRCVRAAGRRWGLREGKPLEIAWEDVARVGIETVLDLDANDTVALAWEHWLRERVVSRLPSLKPENKKKHEEQKPESFPPPRPSDGSDAERVPRHHVRLHRLLGRQVHDAHGKPAGRLEEAKGRMIDSQCLVEEFLLGRGGLLERLSVADLSLVPLRLLGAPHAGDGLRVPWQQMDLSDPTRPRLRCTRDELKAMQPPEEAQTANSR